MNNHNRFPICKIAVAVAVAFALAAPAQADTVLASNSGWITAGGGQNTSGFTGGINNTFTGWGRRRVQQLVQFPATQHLVQQCDAIHLE